MPWPVCVTCATVMLTCGLFAARAVAESRLVMNLFTTEDSAKSILKFDSPLALSGWNLHQADTVSVPKTETIMVGGESVLKITENGATFALDYPFEPP